MHKLPILKPGDTVEIIAPASRCSNQHVMELKALLTTWQLNCIVSETIFGDDLLCANSDDNRFLYLKNALENPEIKGIICARGGYGSMRLLPEFKKIVPPISPKLFVGMSDITALNLCFLQQWHWPVIHGALAKDKLSPESIASLKSIFLGEVQQVEFFASPLNSLAQENRVIEAMLTGGNLSLIQASIGTHWQLNGDNKIIFLEEVGERAYRIDRMLEHLQQAGIFKKAAAILLGDFLGGNEPSGITLVQPVLERFAQASKIPVIQVAGIGHGYCNFPIPLGTPAQLKLGFHPHLLCAC